MIVRSRLRSGATAYLGSALTVKGTTTTITGGDWIKLGFFIDGLTSVTPFVNSVRQTTISPTSAILQPNAVMNIAFSCVAKGGTGVPSLALDWIRFALQDEAGGIVTVS